MFCRTEQIWWVKCGACSAELNRHKLSVGHVLQNWTDIMGLVWGMFFRADIQLVQHFLKVLTSLIGMIWRNEGSWTMVFSDSKSAIAQAQCRECQTRGCDKFCLRNEGTIEVCLNWSQHCRPAVFPRCAYTALLFNWNTLYCASFVHCTCALCVHCTCASLVHCMCASLVHCTCVSLVPCTCASLIPCACASLVHCTCASPGHCTCASLHCMCASLIHCTCALLVYCMCASPVHCTCASPVHCTCASRVPDRSLLSERNQGVNGVPLSCRHLQQHHWSGCWYRLLRLPRYFKCLCSSCLCNHLLCGSFIHGLKPRCLTNFLHQY